MNFSIKCQSGTIRDSNHKTPRASRTYVGAPSAGSICLEDDIENFIIYHNYGGIGIRGANEFLPIGFPDYCYKIESYPESHHA